MKYVAPLREDEIQTLHDMHRYHPSRRARMRAHSLLLSHQGYSSPHIAHVYQVDRRSVSTWIDRWQTMGLVGLSDKPAADDTRCSMTKNNTKCTPISSSILRGCLKSLCG